ncbi:uncharacterized protein LOC114296033 [Camellia sinensis]|uniref:uncharacterized protein LOC114296033 n=1 Tax=Camellia sinensis TaxID=4442 RepID=UPI0010368CDC|nr:uncharacterized protein LOC114296033 [Camellia sinensis]
MVLSNRIKQVMPTIISDSQFVFIGGRNILDGVLIANEIVDEWKKHKIKAKISILVNGSPTSEFKPQRGLRQGDPLSSFLFNIVVEGLNILLGRALQMGLIKGVAMPEGVAKKLEKIQSRFSWGGDELRRKIHLVKWGEITRRKSQGGLGIKKMNSLDYTLSLDKSESIEVVRSRRNGNEEWKLIFRRTLFQWEVKELGRLNMLLLNAPVLRVCRMDSLRWNADKAGEFIVASAYKWSALSSKDISKVIGFIWKNVAPPKAQFFGWLSWKESIKTSCYLQRIGFLSGGSNVNCIFCNDDLESVNHVLLFCLFI